MSLKSAADSYFSSINSIASRICTDLDEIKSNYNNKWETLSQEEREQILEQSIIKPEVAQRYKTSPESNAIKEYAVKRIVDDHFSYRDEHSAPFSFKTQSQRDLTIFGTKTPKKTQVPTKKAIKKKPAPVKPIKIEMPSDDLIVLTEKEIANESDSSCNAVPKTGLDFLDNW